MKTAIEILNVEFDKAQVAMTHLENQQQYEEDPCAKESIRKLIAATHVKLIDLDDAIDHLTNA